MCMSGFIHNNIVLTLTDWLSMPILLSAIELSLGLWPPVCVSTQPLSRAYSPTWDLKDLSSSWWNSAIPTLESTAQDFKSNSKSFKLSRVLVSAADRVCCNPTHPLEVTTSTPTRAYKCVTIYIGLKRTKEIYRHIVTLLTHIHTYIHLILRPEGQTRKEV